MNSNVKKLQTHPNFEKLEKNIWVIHDFITLEERKYYIDIAESASEEDWWKREPGWWHGKFLPIPKDSKIPNQIVERIKLWIEDPNQWIWGSPSSIHRIKPGEKMFLHADNPRERGKFNNWVELSFVLYHNDFNGGEVIYPELKFEYKPLAGDLLMHPGTFKYLHGTNEVLEGPIRYNSTMWAYDKRSEKMHKENKVFEESKIKNQLTALYDGEKPEDVYSMGELEKGKNWSNWISGSEPS